jgi:hypothetical protein
MTASFYLFDVDHGQAAALRLSNGRWCMFDAGCTDTFSPVAWIARKNVLSPLAAALAIQPAFRFLKGTVSHLHGDHLADYARLFQYGPDFFRCVQPDQEHLNDCYATCADAGAVARLVAFRQASSSYSGPLVIPDYGGASIYEMFLPVDVARGLGGDANARVNNASIVTRINVHGYSILLCGDMQTEAWDAVLTSNWQGQQQWRQHVASVDVLLAPHHGHTSAFSSALLNLATPQVVLVSAKSGDESVDNRYSQSPVRGLSINWPDGRRTDHSYISTRDKGHIRIDIQAPANPLLIGAKGQSYWTLGDAVLA